MNETPPPVRPGMVRAHPSRRIFSVSDRITLLIEVVNGFYENVEKYLII